MQRRGEEREDAKTSFSGTRLWKHVSECRLVSQEMQISYELRELRKMGKLPGEKAAVEASDIVLLGFLLQGTLLFCLQYGKKGLDDSSDEAWSRSQVAERGSIYVS